MKTKKMVFSGAMLGAPNLGAPTPAAGKKVDVVDPVKEIHRLMDEVLFNPERVELARERKRIDTLLDKFDKQAGAAKLRIRELYIATLTPAEKEDLSGINYYDLSDMGDDADDAVRIITSERGSVMMIGITMGPIPVLIPTKPEEKVVEEKKDDEK